MAHFAKVENGIVTDVIVADQDFINTGALGDPVNFVQTSYNTRGGIHYVPNSNPPEPSEDQSKSLNKNYAGIGYSWDGIGFAAPQPYPSWTLNPDTYLWEAPVPYPTDGGTYTWDEATQSWVLVDPVV
jgi:hypothetical protein